ncbi:MAG TPA: mannosyl-3-phosphoglycerate phosphatase, partial [bacterium (Candidatus Stahlbacteria)]|nr:mannosyl-3-phosphoglycerate phosphatase [Candidatus Stahlbacteria bacterium]
MLVIFSDLDRCLLGADYRFDTVQKTVQELLKRGNLLIINSSKTRLEIDVIQKRMGFSSPFIVENGSAIFIPDGFLRSKPPFPQRDGYF